MLRMRSPDRVAGGGLIAVELLSLVAAVFGAWYGGELVNRRRSAAGRNLWKLSAVKRRV
jgi:hypothetical protein